MTEGEDPWRPVVLAHLEDGGRETDRNRNGGTQNRRTQPSLFQYDSRGLSNAPRSLTALLVKCMQHRSSERPSFSEIIDELTNNVEPEVSASSTGFRRELPAREPTQEEKAEETLSEVFTEGAEFRLTRGLSLKENPMALQRRATASSLVSSDSNELTSTVDDSVAVKFEDIESRLQQRKSQQDARRASAVESRWSSHLDDASGLEYYYDRLTNTTTWEKPPDLGGGAIELTVFDTPKVESSKLGLLDLPSKPKKLLRDSRAARNSSVDQRAEEQRYLSANPVTDRELTIL
jgi:hypothetical protein